jgi:hypothetical protein
VALGLVINAISQRNRFLKKYLTYLYSLEERKQKAVNILDQIERISTSISTGEGFGGKGNDLSSGYNWWRCRDLNPGHCGYEFEP